MTDALRAFELPVDRSRSRSRPRLAPPVFPPGPYRAVSRRAQGWELTAIRDAERAFPEPEPQLRTPDELAETLESLARELRRRGGEALHSSPGAPLLEVRLRKLMGASLASPEPTK